MEKGFVNVSSYTGTYIGRYGTGSGGTVPTEICLLVPTLPTTL